MRTCREAILVRKVIPRKRRIAHKVLRVRCSLVRPKAATYGKRLTSYPVDSAGVSCGRFSHVRSRAVHMLQSLSNKTKVQLRDVGRRFGLEVRLNGVNSRDDLRLVHFLRMHEIDLVIDVGANKGQFGTMLFAAGFQGSMISFEPLPDAHSELMRTTKASGRRWIVGPAVALSDTTGSATFNVTEASTSSSLHEPRESFVEHTPQVAVAKRIEVKTERLDSFANMIDHAGKRAFLKLDVQGGEAAVLAGASAVLPQLQGVLSELSLVELYAGQATAIEVHQLIAGGGFELWDIWQGYRNPRTQRLTQIDALYFRASARP
ncbi:MAG: FkbM family methyltransferase [Mesorhizobium sp.]|nr:MAG: FkbM family methyltransferase [Mesorhizobium sp.]